MDEERASMLPMIAAGEERELCMFLQLCNLWRNSLQPSPTDPLSSQVMLSVNQLTVSPDMIRRFYNVTHFTSFFV